VLSANAKDVVNAEVLCKNDGNQPHIMLIFMAVKLEAENAVIAQ
jgi:hypothetical protein